MKKTEFEFETDRSHSSRMVLEVPSVDDERIELQLQWLISADDATMWKRPLLLRIGPKLTLDEAKDHKCENYVYLCREDVRWLRDFLTTVLRSPDLRDDETC